MMSESAMQHRFHPYLLSAAIALIAGCGTAAAQQPTQAQADAIRQSCRSDYQSHCASVPPGGSASLQCLQRNLATLSPGCQSAVTAAGGSTAAAPPTAAPQTTTRPAAPPSPMPMREQAMMMRQSCGVDFRTWCQGVGLGGGRALACLADHRESLSEPCREALGHMQGR